MAVISLSGVLGSHNAIACHSGAGGAVTCFHHLVWGNGVAGLLKEFNGDHTVVTGFLQIQKEAVQINDTGIAVGAMRLLQGLRRYIRCVIDVNDKDLISRYGCDGIEVAFLFVQVEVECIQGQANVAAKTLSTAFFQDSV